MMTDLATWKIHVFIIYLFFCAKQSFMAVDKCEIFHQLKCIALFQPLFIFDGGEQSIWPILIIEFDEIYLMDFFLPEPCWHTV